VTVTSRKWRRGQTNGLEIRKVGKGMTMRVDDFTYGQRPLSELPDDDDLACSLHEEFESDDQWVDTDAEHVIQAVVVCGGHIIIWQDKPLTDEDKQNAVAEHEEAMAIEDAFEKSGTEDTVHTKWQREGF
jgi:hypothetical protein